MAVSAVTVTTSATAIFSTSTDDRAQIIIDNVSDYTVYLGDVSTVTSDTGIALDAGDKMILDFTDQHAKTTNALAMWGITENNNADVRVWELDR